MSIPTAPRPGTTPSAICCNAIGPRCTARRKAATRSGTGLRASPEADRRDYGCCFVRDRDRRFEAVSVSAADRDLNPISHVTHVVHKAWGVHVGNPIPRFAGRQRVAAAIGGSAIDANRVARAPVDDPHQRCLITLGSLRAMTPCCWRLRSVGRRPCSGQQRAEAFDAGARMGIGATASTGSDLPSISDLGGAATGSRDHRSISRMPWVERLCRATPSQRPAL